MKSNSTRTGTLVVNAAFLEEIKNDNIELNRLLMAVGQHLTNPLLHDSSPMVLADILNSLREQLSTHFSLEEYFGYFEDAVEVAPRLSVLADILRSQHESLMAEICDLAADAWSLMTPGSSLTKIQLAERFHVFQRTLSEHEAGERELIMQSLYDDIGVGD